MHDMEKVMNGLECCAQMGGEACRQCPYKSECEEGGGGSLRLCADAIALLKEQEAIIEQYRRADGFLAAHGWKWE